MGELTRDYVEWGQDVERLKRTPQQDLKIDDPAARARIGENIAKLVSGRSNPRRHPQEDS
jgi:hypothetical protein